MSDTNEGYRKKYDFFTSYVWCTGFTYAKHVKENAIRIHRTAFLDKIDLKDVQEETDEWRSQINQAIDNSANFILIMTRRFNESAEVIREYKRAEAKKIRIWRFKQKDLDKKDLLSEIDFSQKHYIEFSDEFDLLSKVDEALSGKLKQQTFFENDVKDLVENEGLEIKRTTEPFLEVVVGPTNDSTDWLSVEDEDLLNVCPYRDTFSKIKARRDSFELESNSELTANKFLRVTANGFFHLIEPIKRNSSYWLGIIFNQIAEMLLYCATIMKQKNQNTQQSVHILLKNVPGLEVRIEQFQLPYPKWSFSRTEPKPFVAEFNPSSDWKEIGKMLTKVFKDLCQEISYTQITEAQSRQKLSEILMSNYYVSYHHDFSGLRQHVVIPAIKICDFGLADDKKK